MPKAGAGRWLPALMALASIVVITMWWIIRRSTWSLLATRRWCSSCMGIRNNFASKLIPLDAADSGHIWIGPDVAGFCQLTFLELGRQAFLCIRGATNICLHTHGKPLRRLCMRTWTASFRLRPFSSAGQAAHSCTEPMATSTPRPVGSRSRWIPFSTWLQ